MWLPSLLLAAVPALQTGAPRVVSTSPLHGAASLDPAAVAELRVTFDQDMQPGGYSFMGGGPSFPKVTGQPRWEDPRTIVLPVELAADRVYSLGIGRDTGNAFKGTNGKPSVPTPLVFTTLDLTLEAAARERLAARLGALFPARYSHAPTSGVDWKKRLEDFAPRLGAARSDLHAALLAQEFMDAAGDPHLWVSLDGIDWQPPSAWRTIRRATTDRDLTPNVHDKGLAREIERLGGALKSGESGLEVAQLRAGVHYLRIPTWRRGTDIGAAAERAIRSLGDFHELVIDVRTNGGGDENEARLVASLFTADAVPYVRRRSLQAGGSLGEEETILLEPAATPHPPAATARVVVLIGPGSLSSTEAFALMMQETGALLVGERTLGSSGNPRPYDLTDRVSLMIPTWVSETLAGEPIERIGLSPDVEVKAPRGGKSRRSDATLVRAVELLLDR